MTNQILVIIQLQMSLSISSSTLDIIGIIYSGVAVALAVFECFVRKTHSRALDYIQWAYFLSLLTASVSQQFSQYLYVGSSLLALDTNVLANFYCTLGTYICLRPFSISFLVVLVGFLLIMRFVTIPQKVKQKGITFPRVYNFFKALIKWTYMPLIYLSLQYLIGGNSEILAPVIILAALIVFPLVQAILYKFFDKEQQDPLLKWLQLANYCKAILFALLVVLAVQLQSTQFFYYLALVIVLHAALTLYIVKFKYEKVGRTFYIIGQIIFYFLFSLYVSASSLLSNYYLDLFGLGVIILLDIIYTIMEAKQNYSEWKNGKIQVLPEQSINENRKKNRYDVDDGNFGKLASHEELNDEYDLGKSADKSGDLKKPKNRPKPGK